MTFEEAKKIFLNRGYIEVPGGSYYDADKWRESITVISKWLEQGSCEDAISRQEVLETIDVCNSDGLKGIFCSYNDGERFKTYIKGLPPVIQKKKTGQWIFKNDNIAIPTGYYQCSECEEGKLLNKDNFCPNCGTPMWEVEE